MASVQQLWLTLFDLFFFFKGATCLSRCAPWIALAWKVMMTWPCRLTLSLRLNKCWGEDGTCPRRWQHSNIYSEDLTTRAWQWSYSLTALFSYAFIFGQISYSSQWLVYFSTQTFSQGVCLLKWMYPKKKSQSLHHICSGGRCAVTSLGGKILSACFAHIFKVFGEFPHNPPVFKIC